MSNILQKNENDLGLYVHVPFCTRKCLFCSFVVAIAKEQHMGDYVDALLTEAGQYKGKSIATLYLGGGTPSLLPDDDLKKLVNGLRHIFVFDKAVELTIEANPEHLTRAKAALIKQLGFTRVSLGVQTFHEHYLKLLGRGHEAHIARRAFDYLRESGFNNINIDLMYGFPTQSIEELTQDIDALMRLNSEHVSLYTLTIEPNSRFYAKQMTLDSDVHLAKCFSLVCDTLPQHGIEQYEISNFAKQGFESIHNGHYWLGGEYLGLGVGAHGYLNGRRYWHSEKLQDYLVNPTRIEGFEDLDERTRLMERICFGLRTRRGVEFKLIPADKKDLINDWIKQGLLMLKGETLSTTPQGQLVLDELSVRLI